MTGSTVTKYYYAGTQRIAMRTNGTLSYPLGDHLGSMSLTTSATGTVISELRYEAWGEVRFPTGNAATKYTYTGQYSDSYINLLDYGSRHYDPELGRFIQPDSIVPLASQGVQAWDRYAYVNNSPVKYTDPTGHCIFCIFIPFVLSAVGATPDTFGIAITMVFTDTDNAVVAAGLSVQSQYPWAIIGGDGQGLAQATADELEEGQNPYSPSTAVEVMENRISDVVDACKLCKSPTDNLIVAALAQNYPGFNKNSVSYLPLDPETNTINWGRVMTEPNLGFNNPSAADAKIRQLITGMNYETRLMLKIYMQDLEFLMGLGYQLPDQYVGADFKYIHQLINDPRTVGGHTPQ